MPSPRIAVVRFSALGDVVLLWPVLCALSEAHPTHRITFFTRPRIAEHLPTHPNIEVVGLDVDQAYASGGAGCAVRSLSRGWMPTTMCEPGQGLGSLVEWEFRWDKFKSIEEIGNRFCEGRSRLCVLSKKSTPTRAPKRDSPLHGLRSPHQRPALRAIYCYWPLLRPMLRNAGMWRTPPSSPPVGSLVEGG